MQTNDANEQRTVVRAGELTATTTPTMRTRTGPHPGWWLLVTLPLYAAYLLVAVLTVANRAESSVGELTPDDISGLGLWWVALHLLWVAPPVLAAFGLAAVAKRYLLPRAAAVRVLAVATTVFAVGYLVVQATAWTTTAATWGDSPAFAVGTALSLALGWLGTLPATLLVVAGLVRRGVRRRVALVVGGLVVVYWVLELVTYVPALAGGVSLGDVAGPPPFVLGILWAVLGGALLRARVPPTP